MRLTSNPCSKAIVSIVQRSPTLGNDIFSTMISEPLNYAILPEVPALIFEPTSIRFVESFRMYQLLSKVEKVF